MTSDFFRVVNEARSHSLGPFSPRFNIQTCLLEGLQKFLPADAHERVNGKLHISLTRVYDGKNVIVSQFNSREDLLQVCNPRDHAGDRVVALIAYLRASLSLSPPVGITVRVLHSGVLGAATTAVPRCPVYGWSVLG